jgi:prepilin-type N-terminal cleavage/methylation domain-containing protein
MNRHTRALTRGLTLIEVLIALSVMGVALGAMLFTQVSNLRAQNTTRASSELKAEAVRVVEQVTANVLRIDQTLVQTSAKGLNDPRASYFGDYYWSCPTVSASPDNPLPASAVHSRIQATDCTGTLEHSTWTLSGESGADGEGLITLTVNTVVNGRKFALVNRISCYDVYPSPSTTAPAPCPLTPDQDGAGR